MQSSRDGRLCLGARHPALSRRAWCTPRPTC
jgi:hypothetical protein